MELELSDELLQKLKNKHIPLFPDTFKVKCPEHGVQNLVAYQIAMKDHAHLLCEICLKDWKEEIEKIEEN